MAEDLIKAIDSEWVDIRSLISEAEEAFKANSLLVAEDKMGNARLSFAKIKAYQAEALKSRLENDTVEYFARQALVDSYGLILTLYRKMERKDRIMADTYHYLWEKTDGGRTISLERVTGDCAVRAIATTLGEGYDKVRKELWALTENRAPEHGVDLTDATNYLKSKGWLVGERIGQQVYEFALTETPSLLFCQLGGKGNHFVFVNGKIYDAFNSAGRVVTVAYYKSS